MVKAKPKRLLPLLLLLWLGIAWAEEQLDMSFLEFLGEGQNVDGEYHDPLQMLDWSQKELVEDRDQQEVQQDEP